MRLIEKDEELLLVARVLLAEVASGLKKGKHLVYTPDNIQIPKNKEIKKRNSFKFKTEAHDIEVKECFRLLGVILYHLAKGQSEYTHEAYHADPIDAYLNLSFESALWPMVASMLKGEIQDVTSVSAALNNAEKKMEEPEPEETLEEKASPTSDEPEQVERTIIESAEPNDDNIIRIEQEVQAPHHAIHIEERRIYEYDINQLAVWQHPKQSRKSIKCKTAYQFLKKNNLLEIQLDLADLEAIKRKGIDFFRRHFNGKKIWGWKSTSKEFSNYWMVPCLREVDGQLVINWYGLRHRIGSTGIGLCFTEYNGRHFINCDAEPYIPEGWSIRPEDQLRRSVRGLFEWKPCKIKLHLCAGQESGFIQSIGGQVVRRNLEGKTVLNACILDYLINHPSIIPSEWSYMTICFWGTIYRDSRDKRQVRYLTNHRIRRESLWVSHNWTNRYRAAILTRPT